MWHYSERNKMERSTVEETLGKLEGWPPKTYRTVTQGNKGVNMEMPFGKHEGEEVDDLPTGYIIRALKKLDALDHDLEMEPLTSEMDRVLFERAKK